MAVSLETLLALEDTLAGAEYRAESLRRLVGAVRLVRPLLSAAGDLALSNADAYWNGRRVEASVLDTARTVVWQELDAIGRADGENTQAWIALRALACLLYPAIDPAEVLDIAELCLGLLSRLGVPDRDLERIVTEGCGQ